MTTETADYEPIRVKLDNAEQLLGQAAGPPRKRPVYRAHYETFVLTANDPLQCILPQDDDRVIAHIIPLDNDVVIGPKAVINPAANQVASVPTPMGTLVPAKTTAGAAVLYPVLDNNAVYATLTTTASNSRVSVSATYRT